MRRFDGRPPAATEGGAEARERDLVGEGNEVNRQRAGAHRRGVPRPGIAALRLRGTRGLALAEKSSARPGRHVGPSERSELLAHGTGHRRLPSSYSTIRHRGRCTSAASSSCSCHGRCWCSAWPAFMVTPPGRPSYSATPHEAGQALDVPADGLQPSHRELRIKEVQATCGNCRSQPARLSGRYGDTVHCPQARFGFLRKWQSSPDAELLPAVRRVIDAGGSRWLTAKEAVGLIEAKAKAVRSIFIYPFRAPGAGVTIGENPQHVGARQQS